MPSINCRLVCTGGRPGFLPTGSNGSSFAHCAFVLANPTFAFSFGDPRVKVVADLDQPRPFRRGHDQDGAADTSVLMSAISAIGPTALAQGELAALEVPEELVPFLRRDRAIFLDWP